MYPFCCSTEFVFELSLNVDFVFQNELDCKYKIAPKIIIVVKQYIRDLDFRILFCNFVNEFI